MLQEQKKFPISSINEISVFCAGQFTIPFECLQPGYRHLHLRSIFDEPLENATLFVHIAISDADLAPGTPGNVTPSQNVNSARGVAGKRPNFKKPMKRSRSRKESDANQLLDVNRPELDEIFASASEFLLLAASLRESQRWSLAAFRESCGVSSLASVKQCIRALAHRCRSDIPGFDSSPGYKNKQKGATTPDSEQTEEQSKPRQRVASNDGGATLLRRQQSDTSQSSSSDSSCSGQAKLVKNEHRVSLQLRGSLAYSENWKRTQVTLDALIDDCLAVLDKAVQCCKQLESTYEQIGKSSSVSSICCLL